MKNKQGGFLTEIFRVLEDDSTIRWYTHAHIFGGFIHATNGHVLIKQSLKEVHCLSEEEVKNLEGKWLHKNLLKALHKCDVVVFHEEHIACKTGSVVCKYNYSEDQVKYPNLEKVLKNQRGVQTEIGLDVDLLADLGKALVIRGTYRKQVKLSLGEASHSRILITVKDISAIHNLGILMPVEIS